MSAKAHSLSLATGHAVSWGGRNWRILDGKDGDQLLCTPIGGGPRKFLPVVEAAPPLSVEGGDTATAASPAPGDSAAMLESAKLGMPRTDLGAAAPSQWKRHMAVRRLREMPRESEMSPRQRTAHEQAIETFHRCKEILREPSRRRRRLLTLELSEELGISEATAYRRIEAARRYDTAAGLIRAVRKDAAEQKHPERAFEMLRDALATHRFVPVRKTVADIKTILDGQLKAEGLAPLSKTLIYSEIRKTSRRDQLRAEGRHEQARNEYRLKVNRLPNTDFPLSTIQVDHSPVQLCLVDSNDRQSIGDAWLTLVIDCFSRMILGFFVSLNAPSTLNYGLALAHAFLPKDKYLRRMNVAGSWPCWGIPDLILVDNAAELNGHMIQRARRRYKFTIRRRPVGQPQFGGHVESVFATFMDWIESLPGTKFSNPRKRAEYDSEGRAVLTVAEFEALFTDFVVNEYHLREHSGSGMNKRAPLQRWQAGIHEGDIMPARGLPEVPVNAAELEVSLMPVLEQRVIKQGIVRAFSEKYFSHDLATLSNTLDTRATAKGRKFDLRYDPRDLSKVWVEQGPDREFLPVQLADRTLSPVSLWEHKARRKRLGSPAAIFDDERTQRAVRAQELLASAADRTKKQKRLRREAEKRMRGELHRAEPLRRAPKSSTLDEPPIGGDGPQMTVEQRAEIRRRLPPAV